VDTKFFRHISRLRLDGRQISGHYRGDVQEFFVASEAKNYYTECLIAVDKLMLNVPGMAGGLRRGPPGVVLNGDLMRRSGASTVRAPGTATGVSG
jgi:hypothetical protein